MAFDINTNYTYSESAQVLRAEESEGFLKKFGSPNLEDYLNNEVVISGTIPFSNTESLSNTTEDEQSYMEVYSEVSGVYARIPEGIFVFPTAEARETYLESVKTTLDSFSGYIEFSKIYANGSQYPIPNSPRKIADTLYNKLNNDFRPNAEPAIPYVHVPSSLDENSNPLEYLTRAIETGDKDLILQCQVNYLVRAIEICFVNPDDTGALPMDPYGSEPHTISTIMLALGMINQEYPFVMENLIKDIEENGKAFNSVENVKTFVEDYIRNTTPPVPAKKYPHQNI